MPNLRTTFTNIPPTSKAIAFIIICSSGLGVLQNVKQWLNIGPTSPPSLSQGLALVPNSALWEFWTFITASFYETNLINFIGSVLTILGMGKYLERAWGSREFLKFIGIVMIGANICVVLTYLCEYAITGSPFYLFRVINGMNGLISGFLVGLKQLIPEHLLKPVKGSSLCRVKHLPSLFIIVNFVCFLLFESQTQLLLVFYGSLISWVYLRFFKYQDGLRGDRSETFSMASFFPEFIQPVVKIISNIVFNLLVMLKCCKPISKRRFPIDLENLPTTYIPSMPGSQRAEAERRRALALKALDARLHNKSNYDPMSPPPFTSSPSSYTASSSENVNGITTQPNDVLFDAKDHLKRDL
ncbi:13490_t:CDS:2 [Funneliformis caledonium]|uniref:13490_t:CDS:1 n=1 Tax=Funneliformis caledonium TaxID=1117310 RepID=A0A9N9H752_9GLOM|nr:13490_t:CDS:2 [Funneliformis caledonium]